MPEPDRIRIFVDEIWKWFAVHKRSLPWRDLPDDDPDHKAYLILVSEIMLQQTQVPRVIVLYKEFIRRFPRIEDLAKATNAEVLMAWRGLGYNNRAIRLRDTARTILGNSKRQISHLRPFGDSGGHANYNSEKYQSNSHLPALHYSSDEARSIACPSKPEGRSGVNYQFFPRSMTDLLALPGVGPYTAAAIRNFAFNLPTPCLDTNIRRILHRFFVGPENADGTWRKDDRWLMGVAEKVLKEAMLERRHRGFRRVRRSRGDNDNFSSSDSSASSESSASSSSWHAALMDFGSLVMTKNNPKWNLLSPELRSICKAYGKRINRVQKVIKREPGREIAGKYIPNRIIRGRVVEALRDHPDGLTIDQIGPIVAMDWTMGDFRGWLQGIVQSLMKDLILEKQKRVLRLRS